MDKCRRKSISVVCVVCVCIAVGHLLNSDFVLKNVPQPKKQTKKDFGQTFNSAERDIDDNLTDMGAAQQYHRKMEQNYTEKKTFPKHNSHDNVNASMLNVDKVFSESMLFTGTINTHINSDMDCDNKRFLVYSCHNFCGGLGDRQNGMLSSFLLAELTNRRFIIDMTFPCALDNVLKPNKYNWTVCREYALSRKRINTQTFRAIDGRWDFEKRYQNAFINTTWNKQVIFLTINWHALDLVKHQVKMLNLTRMSKVLDESVEHLAQMGLDILFRPTKRIEHEVRSFLKDNVGDRKLICSHIRFGKNPTIPLDNVFPEYKGHTNVSTLFHFLKQYNDPQKYAMYIATDNEKIRAAGRELFDNFVTFNKTIIHIDRLHVSRSAGCDGFYNALEEQTLLSKCSILLLTTSNFGIMASLQDTNLTELYLYDGKRNTIIRSDPMNVIRFYNKP